VNAFISAGKESPAAALPAAGDTTETVGIASSRVSARNAAR